MPRSPLSHQTSRNGGSGKSAGVDSDEEEEEEDDYSSSGAEDASVDSAVLMKPEIVEEVELVCSIYAMKGEGIFVLFLL